MARGGHEVIALDSKEIVCPVCLEEYEEPKSLPSCVHNVCYQCLEGMARRKSKNINCPVCRTVSRIPRGGVAGFPKNHLLASLVDKIPGRQEKKMISKALKNCEEKMEVLGNSLTEMKRRFETAQEKAEETRREIESTANRAMKPVQEKDRYILGQADHHSRKVECVKEEERDLLKQVNHYMRKHFNHDVRCMLAEDVVDLLTRASICIEICRELLDKDELNDMKRVHVRITTELNIFAEALELRTVEASCKFKVNYGLKLSKPSELPDSFLRDGYLGKLSEDTAEILLPRPINFSDCGPVMRSIDYDDAGGFSPSAVAVSMVTGNLAILDEADSWVRIVNLEGEKQSKLIAIEDDDLRDVAFNSDDDLVVADRERNCLLHFHNRNGKFEKTCVDVYPPRVPGVHKLKLTFVSIDPEGRYIVTSHPYDADGLTRDAKPGVCVYSSDRKFEMVFGTRGELDCPGKAIWHKGAFFVPDSEKNSIVVFDKRGRLCHEIGKGMLSNPCRITSDSVNDTIIVCDDGDISIKIFSRNGALISKFHTELGTPEDVVLSKDGKEIIVLLCKTDEDDEETEDDEFEDRTVVTLLAYIVNSLAIPISKDD